MQTEEPAIKSLPIEKKRSLLAVLARELLINQSGFLSVADADGEMILCALPKNPKAAAERALQEADPEYIAKLHLRALDQSEPISFEDAIELQPPKKA